jgi:hypothetical protein
LELVPEETAERAGDGWRIEDLLRWTDKEVSGDVAREEGREGDGEEAKGELGKILERNRVQISGSLDLNL